MITICDLNFKYPETENYVIRNFDFFADRGEFVVLVGESGCGKTTIIRLLMRELVASSGKLMVLNKDLMSMKEKDVPLYRRNIGVVFQDAKLISDISVYENIMFVAKVTGMKKKEAEARAISVMNMMGITELHRRLPTQLSGGQCQKVCLARALMLNPTILLCDEPTGNLDPDSSIEIMKLLDLIHKTGVTIVMASHDMELVKKFDVRIFSLEKTRKDGVGDGEGEVFA